MLSTILLQAAGMGIAKMGATVGAGLDLHVDHERIGRGSRPIRYRRMFLGIIPIK